MKTILRKGLPAKYYQAFYVVVILAVLIGLNFKLYWEASHFLETVAQDTQFAAHKELSSAIERLIKQEQAYIKSLAERDEIVQQALKSSDAFWGREAQFKKSPYWRTYYKEVVLYNSAGNVLGRTAASTHNILPKMLNIPPQEGYFKCQNNQVYLMLSAPVVNISNFKKERVPIGYIAVAIDFVPALLSVAQFKHIDQKSLRLDVQAPKTFPLNELSHYLKYRLLSGLTDPVNEFLWHKIQYFFWQNVIGILFAALLYILVVRKMVIRPLSVLSQYLKTLKNHPDKEIPPPKETFHYHEYEVLKNSMDDFHHALLAAKKKIEHQHQLAEKMAKEDRLTGLPNRLAFEMHLFELEQCCEQTPCSVGFLVIDCDFFKAINDTYGHEVGDAVIQQTALLLVEVKSECAQLFRIGGDEFVIICQCQQPEGLGVLAEKIESHLNHYDFSMIAEGLKVSFSIGGDYISGARGEDVMSLHKHADVALYQSKHSIGHKVHFYDEMAIREAVLLSNNDINTVVHALKTGDGVQMHIQPIVNRKQIPQYYETLIRIETKEGLMYPDRIFPIIQHRHLEVALDKQVVQKVLEILKAGVIESDKGLSINLSGATVVSEDIVKLLLPIVPFLSKYKIVVEVVEDVLIEHIEEISEKLNQLRAMGFKIALDDFGSGYSSIRYLAKMPVDVVKFDRTLTLALLENVQTAHIMKTTAKMIRDAGYDLVIEGIEDEAHFQAALEAGANYFQGYLWSKSYPAMSKKTSL